MKTLFTEISAAITRLGYPAPSEGEHSRIAFQKILHALLASEEKIQWREQEIRDTCITTNSNEVAPSGRYLSPTDKFLRAELAEIETLQAKIDQQSLKIVSILSRLDNLLSSSL